MSTQTKHEERKKRIILIGRSTAGKTTLCQRINNEELRYYKTQTVQVINQNMIDTPGEYLERRGFRGALVVTSADADHLHDVFLLPLQFFVPTHAGKFLVERNF